MSAPVNRLLASVLTSIFLALTVLGCSGGISGTGDGDIIITPDSDNNSDNADSISEGTADSIANLPHFPGSIATPRLTSALNLTVAPLDQTLLSTTGSVSVALNNHIQSYAEVADLVSGDLLSLETELASELRQCSTEGVCGTVPASITISTNDATVDRFFSSLEYTRGQAGYFDNRLTYRRENGDVVALQWSADKGTVSLYTESATHTTHSLHQGQQPSLTFRQLNKTDNTFIQASLNVTDSNNTTIEADTTDWYVKALISDQNSVVYAASTANNQLRREAITQENNTVMAETCGLPDCLWQPEHDLTTDVFEGSPATVGNFAETYIDNTVSFPEAESVTRFVVSTALNGEDPAPDSLVCGATTVQQFQRVFCWVPLPLEFTDPFLFEETINPGNITYRRLSTL